MTDKKPIARTDTDSSFFDPHQRATVEAAMARIIPTDELPGAREANTIEFLDRYLSGLGYIYAKADGSGFEQVTGKDADAWWFRVDTLRTTYLDGIEELDRRSTEAFGEVFLALNDQDQDQILTELERSSGAPPGTPEHPGASAADLEDEKPALQQTSAELDLPFFPLLAFHTRQGFYADPIYGGNQDQVGWQVIGFPGPSSLEEVRSGRYTTIEYFADLLGYPERESNHGT